MSYPRNLARLARTGAPTVATAQDLRDLVIYGGIYPERIQTQGAVGAGDGGHGTWRWEADSTDADDLGTVLALTGHSGAGRYVRDRETNDIYVSWYGVVSDTDSAGAGAINTAAIEAAWALALSSGGGNIRLPAAQLFCAPICLTADSVTNSGRIAFRGVGGKSALSPLSGAGADDWLLRFEPATTAPVAWLRMSDIALLGADAGQTTNGLYIGASNNCRLVDVDVQNFIGYGLVADRAYDLYLERLRCKKCGSASASKSAVLFSKENPNGLGTNSNANFCWVSDFVIEDFEYYGFDGRDSLSVNFTSGKIHGRGNAATETGCVLLQGGIYSFSSTLFTRIAGPHAIKMLDNDGLYPGDSGSTCRASFTGSKFLNVGTSGTTLDSYIENHSIFDVDLGDSRSAIIVDGTIISQPWGTGGYLMRISNASPKTDTFSGSQVFLGAANDWGKINRYGSLPIDDQRSDGSGQSMATRTGHLGVSLRQRSIIDHMNYYDHGELFLSVFAGNSLVPPVRTLTVKDGANSLGVIPGVFGPHQIFIPNGVGSYVYGRFSLPIFDASQTGRAFRWIIRHVDVLCGGQVTQDFAGGNYWSIVLDSTAAESSTVTVPLDQTQADYYFEGTKYRQFAYGNAKVGGLFGAPGQQLLVSAAKTGTPPTPPDYVMVSLYWSCEWV